MKKLFICDQFRKCKGVSTCGTKCTHTTDSNHAINKNNKAWLVIPAICTGKDSLWWEVTMDQREQMMEDKVVEPLKFEYYDSRNAFTEEK